MSYQRYYNRYIVINIIQDENIVIDTYGSFSTNLSIESSDIDLAVVILEESILNFDRLINNLCTKITSMKNTYTFENINVILTASVPVIKLVIMNDYMK